MKSEDLKKEIIHAGRRAVEQLIKVGDLLLVHHNVFKFYNGMKGRQKSGKSFFKDDLFFIENDQFFMYKQNDQWICHDRYCFVKPVPVEESFIMKLGKEEPLVGIMKYPNKYLSSQGVESGDKISFKPNSEYEFTVDDEKLYSCLLYTSPSPRDRTRSRMPSSA